MTSCKLTFVNVIEFSLILLPIVSDFVILSGAFDLKLGLHHLDEMVTLFVSPAAGGWSVLLPSPPS